jgi:hypothetical protein
MRTSANARSISTIGNSTLGGGLLPRLILTQQITKRWRKIACPPSQTKSRRHTHHRRDGQRVLAEIDLLAEGKPRVEVLQRDSSAGERLNQGELNGTELIATAEIGLNISDKLIERLRRARSAIKLGAGK